ncbi:FIST N-terminal domain-containing protein [Mongoliimonas terrestris]|uniref:FIST N-terminal domain-containing protein n=1 Tax=Mongoliimonas terrestris TaxID=1709001 RepID=UPI000AE28AC1|nr:FIST N-terminal domain-containing protein [Mongoliimonas terrestris]
MSSRTDGPAFTSGIRALSVSEASLDEAVAAVRRDVDPADVGFLIVFYAASYDSARLGAAFARVLPGVPVVGCSTAGEISSDGLSDGGMVAIAFPRAGFEIVSGVIPDLSRLSVDRGSETVAALKAELARRRPALQPRSTFAVSLIDGLCMREEAVVSAIDWALGDIPLVGGSAGDGLAFRATSLLHDGVIHTDAAILILVHTDHPFQVFKTDNFHPTGQRLVVTASDPETRTVYELNAEVAADEYATLVGLDADRLSPFGFASHPMVVRVGGEYFCRSLRSTNPDGSLSFFCAIDDGVVLTVAEPVDLVDSVETTLAQLDRDLGGIDWILGFDCVLRRLDAQNRQVAHRISEIYRRHNVFGFNTYGEQYRTMHLNQTFTGVAIGRGGPAR